MSETVQLERQLEECKKAVDRRDMVRKLVKNREFRKLILEDFCVEECARYVHASADPALRPENRADALAIAQAAGHLKRYLSVVERMGDQAEYEMGSIEESLVAARTEEGI